ncbi:hypothetical protein ACLK17_20370 [Escherichia coli]
MVDDEELLQLVEMEVRALLPVPLPGDDTPIVRGSRLKVLEGDESGKRNSRTGRLPGFIFRNQSGD